ncbi:hypothetical protein KCP78_02740 [Salmonella enterica subsp. enterica]|nr:hypothetical protein KCP78_02740 [Salmonella enterica subsp. enterica]
MRGYGPEVSSGKARSGLYGAKFSLYGLTVETAFFLRHVSTVCGAAHQ